ncbi:MAG: sigma 54-interacting transcriptional regulator [Balneolales bacterium]
MTATNSFWREVLDFLPNLVLIFRIDKDEQVQLMFANRKIEATLGFSPREFVLASETHPLVQRKLDSLVEIVARHSHAKAKKDKQEITLLTKRGDEKGFTFDFELFKVKSSPASFLAVNLREAGTDILTAGETVSTPRFVAESPAMKAVMENIDALITADSHVLIRGEKSTGKKTLARILVKPAKLAGSEVIEVNASTDALPLEEEVPADDTPLIFLIRNIDLLPGREQARLKQMLDKRKASNLKTRVISTSSTALESLLEENRFEANLYYTLSFHPVLLPPLRHRKEDVVELFRYWTQTIPALVHMPALEWSAGAEAAMAESKWEGNFDEFFAMLRQSLVFSGNGKFRFSEKAKPEKSAVFSDAAPEEEYVSYDEMNRRYLRKVLEKTRDKIYGKDGAARLLGLKPTTLQSKLKKLGIR